MTMIVSGRFIRALGKNQEIMHFILRDVTQEQATSLTDGADGWNTVQVIGHLFDAEEVFFRRARLMVEEDNPNLPSFDHERIVAERGYATRNLREVLDAYIGLRGEFLTWLQARSDEDWAQTGIHPEAGMVTVMEQALQTADHDVNHMEQIVQILKQR